MFVASMLTPLVLAADPSPPAESTAPPSPQEQRVADLEREVERLRLQATEAETPPAATPPQAPPNVFNPTLTVIGNALYRYDDRPVFAEEERIDNQFNLRETELDFRAAVDPFADGVAILAVVSPSLGRFELELEEGYATVKRLPIPVLDDPPLGLKLKVGRFRAEVGRVNRLHLHDLPHPSRPIAAQEFFGDDGFRASGLSAQLFLPTPFDEASAVELTAQVLSGGGTPVAGGTANTIGLVGNLRWFRTFADVHHVDLSVIVHFGRTDPEGRLSSVTASVDFLYKWRPLRGGEFRSFVLGGQAFYAQRAYFEPLDLDGDGTPDVNLRRDAAPFGYFGFAQVQLSRALHLGLRWDDARAIDDGVTKRRGASGYLTWYPSEYLRLRAGYERRLSDRPDENGRNSVFVEMNVVFGAHPTEPFWVNR